MSIKSLYGNLNSHNNNTNPIDANSILNSYRNIEVNNSYVDYTNQSLKQIYTNRSTPSEPVIHNAEFINYDSKKNRIPKKPKTLLPSYVNKY